ncbi:uncharacterized protein LOC115720699 [Cannabis sativa]|uniref:uncharacterized protein LOC115720699 n=1 Tax=Cannabis sativa TaxID=3483 RepID=UPI0029CA77E6|nr:uncharacterized protein LOC115720699 [Cannabis sativa]
MVRYSNLVLLLIISLSILLALTQAEPNKPKKPKKIKCKDKWYPDCYKKDLYCPESCPRTCFVDCRTCQPLCTQPPPSPPPPPKRKPRSPPPPPATTYSPPPPQASSWPPPPVNNNAYPPPPPTQTPTPTPATPQSPPPPSEEAAGGKRVRCRNKNYPSCYGMEHTCPSACPDQCEVDCVTCSPVCNCNKPGAVCQDPRFIGGDGLTFYFHGKKDHDFCLVSDSNLHINAHFIGKRNPNMTRDFTWVQSLGILFDNHKLFIGAKKTSTWSNAIDRLSLAFDGEPVLLPVGEGATWQSPESSIAVSRTQDVNSVEIEVEGNFKLKATVVPITKKESQIHQYGITEEDCFAHLDVSFKFFALSREVNGVLGQTYGKNYVSRVKMGLPMSVLGGERKFSASSLFAADCMAARFDGKRKSGLEDEFVGMECGSGMGGRGVVCKK